MSKAGEGDKRKVSTDALDTLGSIITPAEKRDAIHLAVEPVQATVKVSYRGSVQAATQAATMQQTNTTANQQPGRAFARLGERDAPWPARACGRADRAEFQPRALHQLREPAGLVRAGGAGRPGGPRRWKP